MLHPLKMQKVRIYAVKSLVDPLIKRFHELGMVEIDVSEKNQKLQSGAPLESFNDISAQLVRIRGIKANLPKREVKPTMEFADPLAEARKVTIDEELKKAYESISKLQTELASISEELNLTKKLSGFGKIDFSRLETRSTGYVVGVIPRKNLNKVREELKASNISNKFMFSLSKEEAFLLIIFEKGDYDIQTLLLKHDFVKMDVPPNLTIPEKYIFWLERETKNKQKMIEDRVQQVEVISNEYYETIANLEKALSIAADRAEITSRFLFSKSVFVIEGWVEARNFGKVEKALEGYEAQAMIEKTKRGHQDVAPTVLENIEAVKPYQFMTESFSFPNSQELDPSMIYFFTIPLLYGMIVGDVLYGLVSIPIALYFMKNFKSELMQNVSRLWLFAAIPSIIFGFVFDEFAGMSHYKILTILEQWGILNLSAMSLHEPLYHGLSRLHYLASVLQITLYVGMLHLALGLVMGAINEWHHSKKHALGKIAWIGVELGGYLVIASFMFNLLPANIGNIGAGILGVSVLALAWVEGVVGILELPGIAGNVFSYMRIAIVGVVGAILAELINAMFVPLPKQGIFALILLPLFLGLHLANGFVAMFEALIQGGRLNIIEFKLKFFKGGGRPFRPFSLSKYIQN